MGGSVSSITFAPLPQVFRGRETVHWATQHMKSVFLFLAVLMSVNEKDEYFSHKLTSYWLLSALAIRLPLSLLLEEKLRSRRRMEVSQGHVESPQRKKTSEGSTDCRVLPRPWASDTQADLIKSCLLCSKNALLQTWFSSVVVWMVITSIIHPPWSDLSKPIMLITSVHQSLVVLEMEVRLPSGGYGVSESLPGAEWGVKGF